MVAGEAATVIDLTSLTHTPEGLYADETAYTYSGGTDSAAITASISRDGRLTVSAPRDATVGTVVSIPITIAYTQGTVSAGITARVVQSTRPLAQLRSHAVKLKAGGTQDRERRRRRLQPVPRGPADRRIVQKRRLRETDGRLQGQRVESSSPPRMTSGPPPTPCW